ncbi:MAG TPA: hypothetical protein PKG54_00725 [Phycisphaerae bacterium]|nr:hypothetical protein [Phycisphaerae bacterium]HOB73022.1 hypothetical protein [Phycisphaerae bacterium]HOJ52929.1 hypothetical protein [Phycisphaerae bacterium]HOL24666.1 hypothetical protein [Phycisphaerae bacterium]HPP19202.1 hypothetical protein [Phycisphaerae bacterium]
MFNRKWISLAVGECAAVFLLAGLTGCERNTSTENDGMIDNPPLVDEFQGSPAPTVAFPEHLKTGDVVLNEFIRKALDCCAKGDYDRFRQLFGISYQPPDANQFRKLWQGVKLVKIEGIYHDQRQPNDYYVHAVIELRKPDRRDRSERQAVIWVFREGDEWRIGPAPSDIAGRVLVTSTQPGVGFPTQTQPADTPAGSAAGGSAAAAGH